jgi:hypothetical protein
MNAWPIAQLLARSTKRDARGYYHLFSTTVDMYGWPVPVRVVAQLDTDDSWGWRERTAHLVAVLSMGYDSRELGDGGTPLVLPYGESLLERLDRDQLRKLEREALEL